jgi:hypothetical protein
MMISSRWETTRKSITAGAWALAAEAAAIIGITIIRRRESGGIGVVLHRVGGRACPAPHGLPPS